MAEVEIHAGHEHSNDEFGRRVGVMVGIIGIILAVVTISSHRAHTAAVIAREGVSGDLHGPGGGLPFDDPRCGCVPGDPAPFPPGIGGKIFGDV